jgi:hypothetical protein
MTAAEFRGHHQKMMSEDDLLRWIVQLAHAHRWMVHHSRPAMMKSGTIATALTGDPGLPDLVLVRKPRVIFAELKSERGSMRSEQKVWRAALEECTGVEYFVWRPRDQDAIVAALT